MIDRRDFLVRSAGIALGGMAAAGCAKPQNQGTAPSQGGRPRSFDLEVYVTGLCVFIPVPDKADTPDPKKSKVHVLMVSPAADPGGAGNYDDIRHYPRIFYDAAHDGGSGPERTYWHVVPLERTILDLSNLELGTQGTKGGTLKDIDGLVDISKFTDPLPHPEAVTVPHLSSRVTLPLAYDIGYSEPRDKWQMKREGHPEDDESKDHVTWQVIWKLQDVVGDSLILNLSPFSADLASPLNPAPLRPIARGDRHVVQLYISNDVFAESGPPRANPPPPPHQGTALKHFTDFQDLYEGVNVKQPWPQLFYDGPPPPRGTPYTCLPSGGH